MSSGSKRLGDGELLKTGWRGNQESVHKGLPGWLCCVTLGKSLPVSGPQLSHLTNKVISWDLGA